MSFKLNLDKEFLNRFFPFYLIVDRDLIIKYTGTSLRKLTGIIVGEEFLKTFLIKRPAFVEPHFTSLLDFLGQIFILKFSSKKGDVLFRYEALYLQEIDALLFVGSPWITLANELKTLGLSLRDFALHDSMTDLLQVLTVREINTNEVSDLNKKLEKSEQRYRQIVESAHDLIYYLDHSGYLTYVNPVILEKFNTTVKDIIGRHFSEFIDPEFRDSVINFYLKKKEERRRKTYLEFPIRIADEKIMWIGQNVSTNFDSNGDPISFISVARDITERKNIEENLKSTELRLRNLIKNLQAGILVEDEKRRIVLTNSFFCDLFEIPLTPEQMTGFDCSKSAEESKHLFENDEEFVQDVNKILNDRKTLVGSLLKMKNGKILERDYIPILFKDKYLGHLWQYRDVTETKLAEEKLIKATHEAEKAQKAEELFLARMSHEIRTPLNAIVGITHLLADSNLSEEQSDYIEILLASSNILQKLINDILDLSKISAGQMKVNDLPFNLNKNLISISNSFKHKLAKKSVEMKLEFDKNINAHVVGDELLLNQILINVLSNAVKFTDSGSIELATKLIKNENNIQLIQFVISDTGIGVTKDNFKKIFEQFKQANENISRQYAGTGLGLAIVKLLTEILDGKIEFDSEFGEGSTFTILLPLKLDKNHDASNEVIYPKSNDSLKGVNILVAEDNRMNRLVISRLLEKWNANFNIVTDGLEAIESIKSNTYDIILMDLQMPNLNGFEASKRIRNMTENPNHSTTIIALTASALKEFKDKAEKSGINDFITKPFQPKDLFEKLIFFSKRNMDYKIIDHNKYSFSKKLDNKYLSEFYGQDYKYAAEMFKIFLDHEYDEFLAIKEVIQLNKLKDSIRLIHKLSPSFSMVGMTNITRRLVALENSIKDENSLEENLKEIELIEEEVNLLLPTIRSEYYRMQNIKSDI